MCVQTLAATTGWVVVLSVYFLQFFQDKDETNGVRGKKNGMKGRRGAAKELNYFFLIAVV